MHVSTARTPDLTRDLRRGRFTGYHLRIHHEQHMRERRSKVRPVDGSVAVRFGGIDVFAARTVKFDGPDVGCVAQADGEKGLLVAVDARATAKVCAAVFLELCGEGA